LASSSNEILCTAEEFQAVHRNEKPAKSIKIASEHRDSALEEQPLRVPGCDSDHFTL
jgi:hypothetical protein